MTKEEESKWMEEKESEMVVEQPLNTTLVDSVSGTFEGQIVIDNNTDGIPWDKRSHIDHLKHYVPNGDIVFINRDIHPYVTIEEIEILIDEVTASMPRDSFDVCILHFNREVLKVEKWTNALPFKRNRFRGSTGFQGLKGMAFEDVSCYMVAPSGTEILKNTDDDSPWESMRMCRYENSWLTEENDNWSGGRYLDEGSPILLCHLLEKWKGRSSYVYVRPLTEIYGFKVSFVYVCLFLASFCAGLLGIPNDFLLRAATLLHIIEPMEGLVIKVVFVLIVMNVLHLYGNDPLFFL